MSDDKERVAFEKWYSTTPSVLGVRNRFERDKHEPEEYYFIGTRKSFAAWMAAKSEAQPSDGALTNEGAEPVASLAALLPDLSDALEDLEVWGRHTDQGYRKLLDWYRKVALACKLIDSTPTCTCPSGDGSLRWPCPVHPHETAAGVWHEGSPPHPWDSEWFLAKMVQGAFVVLRPLPEEYTYDFTTADGTYVMRKSIARWAQLSGSEYISPASASVVLPERKKDWSGEESMGWNACLDRVKELNS